MQSYKKLCRSNILIFIPRLNANVYVFIINENAERVKNILNCHLYSITVSTFDLLFTIVRFNDKWQNYSHRL